VTLAIVAPAATSGAQRWISSQRAFNCLCCSSQIACLYVLSIEISPVHKSLALSSLMSDLLFNKDTSIRGVFARDKEEQFAQKK
jgi:hypothetical protein